MKYLLPLLMIAALTAAPVWTAEKPASLKPVDKAPPNQLKKEAVPGKLVLEGTWDVQLTEEQIKTRDAHTSGLFGAKQFVFSGKALTVSQRQFSLPWGFALDTTAKPARLKLWTAVGPLRLGLHMKYHVRLLPCLVERVNGETIRIAFKRSAVVVKPLVTIGPRGSRPGPGPPGRPGRGGRRRFDPRKPIPEAMVNAKIKGVTLQYPKKITHFGDLKGDLVVIPLRRAKADPAPPVTNNPGEGAKHPAWLVKMIKQFEASRRSPQAIYRYTCRGKLVYFVPPRGPDQYSTVYDAEGNVLGHPSGGFSGRGDGKMKDFLKTAKDRLVVWQKKRDLGAEWKHWLSRCQRVEKSLGPGAALKMWKYHLQRNKLTGEKKKHANREIRRLEATVKENPDDRGPARRTLTIEGQKQSGGV